MLKRTKNKENEPSPKIKILLGPTHAAVMSGIVEQINIKFLFCVFISNVMRGILKCNEKGILYVLMVLVTSKRKEKFTLGSSIGVSC